MKPNLIGNIYNEKFHKGGYGGDVYGADGIAPTLKATSSASQQYVLLPKDNNE